MLEQYFPILMFIFVGLAVGVALPLAGGTLSRLLGVHRPDPEKLSPYECGFEAFEDARMKFDVRYYLIAILFIVISPDIGRLLLNTTVGNIALAFAVFMELAGLYVVRRMAVIEV